MTNDNNTIILDRMRGVPAQPGTPETDADPRNPNVRQADHTAINGCSLVMVTWYDSRRPWSEWRFISEIAKPDPVRCVSVGWLLHDLADVKVLAPNMGDFENKRDGIQAGGVIEIPTRSILSIRHLEETAELPVKRLEAAE